MWNKIEGDTCPPLLIVSSAFQPIGVRNMPINFGRFSLTQKYMNLILFAKISHQVDEGF